MSGDREGTTELKQWGVDTIERANLMDLRRDNRQDVVTNWMGGESARRKITSSFQLDQQGG